MKDHKDVWCEAYDNAIEDGYDERSAEKIAEEAVVEHMTSLVDDAMNRLQE